MRFRWLAAAALCPAACTVYLGGDEVTSAPAPAELVIRNAALRGPGAPAGATSLAVRDGRIVAMGGVVDTRAFVGLRTRVLDVGGGCVVPGLVDAHAHLLGLGMELGQVDLRGAKSEDEMVARVAAFARERDPASWIVGRGWDQNLWPGAPFPTRAPLDRAVGDRPVFLVRVDGHAAIASSAALSLAKVSAAARDPDGGRILRNERGEPTGVLIDGAMGLVREVMPKPTAADRERAYLAAQDAALAAGLTCVHDAGLSAADQETLAQLDREGRLRLRVYGMASADAIPERASAGSRFELRAVKAYADGALGSRGAALLDDYSDEPGNRGLLVTTEEALAKTASTCVDRGLQLCVHAIGDRGVRVTLDAMDAAFRDVRKKGSDPFSCRWRVEHAQVVQPRDFDRFATLGIVASMQPTHATSDGPWAPARVGAERMKGAYAWRRFLDLGVPLAFGSDFPVESVDPRLGLYAAVTRRAPSDPNGPVFGPSPPLSKEEALAAFTSGAAFAGFHEGDRGAFAIGAAADLTVFDSDPFAPGAPPEAILRAGVVWTVIGGEVEFPRDAAH